MLEALFGSRAAERVLLHLQNYGEGYGRDIAQTFGLYPTSVNAQLRKFEEAGFLVRRTLGRTRLYSWNPRNPLVAPLRTLLQAALESLPENELETYFRQRHRPRKFSKP
ncbi:MAG: winged helix-turn-helix domain-containing protein [Sphingomonadales bacterium]|nr:winged helix-turn-helix domain-containing protein [Sphingomonadales bacterium]